MRRFTLTLICAFLGALPATIDARAQGAQPDQHAWEQRFRQEVSAQRIGEYMKRLTAHPHAVSQPYDKDNAEWMLSQFKQWGFDAHIETFQVLFPTPKERVVEMIAPTRFTLKLQEPVVPGDPTTVQTGEQLPTYNAYSPDGDVTAPLVYVNYGDREDYEQLDRLGISVKGAIVIARYGSAWRGTKPKVAAEHGAIGCLIYSDPQQDGYVEGVTFPEGGWRNKDGVQRGSVMDTDYPGDPTTPGAGSTADAKRTPMSEIPTIQKIPVLPISYADAQPLLAALAGPVAPDKWRGGLPITYHVGPGPAKVHLKVTSDWTLKPVHDVIATLKGSTYPDEWIVRGNHHDGWVYGADDPTSGMSAVLEEGRALGEMVKQGWRPKRTIILCGWDGEEPGLLGSTEWVETHLADLQQHAVAYINSDSNGRGFFYAGGSSSLEHFISDVVRDVTDPEKKMPVYERSRLARIERFPDQRADLRRKGDLRNGELGDGSDYTPFLHHAGIASLNIGFGGEDDGTQYHSIYDDFYWYTHFADTDFAYGAALAQVSGTALMRLADVDVLPFQFTNEAAALRRYVDHLEKDIKKLQDEAKERNTELDEGVFTAVADPKKTELPPPRLTIPPFMNIAALENAVAAVNDAADRYSKAAAKANGKTPAASLPAINARLIATERALLAPNGQPQRPWFKYVPFAPGAYSGYGALEFGAVREYLDQKKWNEADDQIPAMAAVLMKNAEAINAAAEELEKAGKP
ncbi:MAG TPA: M28 family metallopeptidase [Terriglobales bacterium]|nr:M28 family metallopeptidase [Terriglobales bacterium]